MIRKILIVSDSHRRTNNVKTAIDRERPDMLIHLGDIEDNPEEVRAWLDAAARARKDSGENVSLPIPAVFIQGNCDVYGPYKLSKSAVFEVNNHRFFCSHGHVQGVNMGIENLFYTAQENDCDIAMFGHTHVPFDDEYDGVRILNPGSISEPRGGSKKGYIVMTFENEDDYEIERKNL